MVKELRPMKRIALLVMVCAAGLFFGGADRPARGETPCACQTENTCKSRVMSHPNEGTTTPPTHPPCPPIFFPGNLLAPVEDTMIRVVRRGPIKMGPPADQ